MTPDGFVDERADVVRFNCLNGVVLMRTVVSQGEYTMSDCF